VQKRHRQFAAVSQSDWNTPALVRAWNPRIVNQNILELMARDV